MEFSKVIAIINPDRLEAVEEVLRAMSIPGMNVSQVRGYGNYKNFYTSDWLTTHSRIEVFVMKEDAEKVADAIMTAAHTGLVSDGFVSISPIESLYHISTKQKCSSKTCV